MSTQYTPGPWLVYISGNIAQVDNTPSATGARPCIVEWAGFDGNDLSARANKRNARYIAAANPATITALLDERDAQAAEIARLRDAVQETVRVIESNPSSITDTVWVTGNKPETLLDRCRAALAQEQGGSDD